MSNGTMSIITPPLTPHHSPSPATSCLDTPRNSFSPASSHPPTRKRLRTVIMRAGTSKGLFFHLSDLPADRHEWGPVILAAMGSPDRNLKQLDGLGGGQSTLSKVAVVSRSESAEADVDYLFIQVPVDGDVLDFSGNCGNMASGVGPFAVDEGLVAVGKDETHEVTVRIRNVNTDRIIHSTFPVSNRLPLETGSFHLDGVTALSSPIRLDFLDPSGSMTGKLLPTGVSRQLLSIPALATAVEVTTCLPIGPSTTISETVPLLSAQPSRDFLVSCVDAANPFIFVQAFELGLSGTETNAQIAASCTVTLMDIRARMAVQMGLAKTYEAALLVSGTPKIAIVGPPCSYISSNGKEILAGEIDIWVRAFSMGRPHDGIQMTGAVCVGAASAVPGCVVEEIVRESRARRAGGGEGGVVIGHASGTMAVDGDSEVRDGEVKVRSGSVYRTARRLMEGSVLYLGSGEEERRGSGSRGGNP